MLFLVEPFIRRKAVRKAKGRIERELAEIINGVEEALCQTIAKLCRIWERKSGHGKKDPYKHRPECEQGRYSPSNSSASTEKSEQGRNSPITTETLPSQRHQGNRLAYNDRLLPPTQNFRLFTLAQGAPGTRIIGQFRTWSLDHHPAYEALSYAWGNALYIDEIHQENPNLEGVYIQVNDRPFFVERNLHEALLDLREEYQHRTLWIDAICINQNDNREKSHQVSLMRTIYTEAESVVAWLGAADLHSNISMGLIREVNEAADRCQRLGIITNALQSIGYNFETVYTDTFQRSFWYRTWIIQEIFSAREITLQCGQDKISWRALGEFQRFLSDECYGDDRRSLPRIDRYHPWASLIGRHALEDVISCARQFHILDKLRKSRPQLNNGKQPPNLHTLLFEHWDARATDPRDKIFALKGLAIDGVQYEMNIDYEHSVNQVYTHFVREYTRLYGKLDIILRKRPQNPTLNLPSWCPDWSSTISCYTGGNAIKDAYPFRTAGRPYEACGVTRSGNNQLEIQFSPCKQVLIARGWTLDRIRDHSHVARFRVPRENSLPPPRPSRSSRHTEFEPWYAMHRCALRRGFERGFERDRDLGESERHEWHDYCRRKHDQFFYVLRRAMTLEVEEFIDTEMLEDWRRDRDVLGYLERWPDEVMTDGLRRVVKRLGQRNVQGAHRCFFVTESGIMGLAPNATQRDDIIVVLKGCSLPVVLRAAHGTGGRWVLVGACYVVGFMHGQFNGAYREKSQIREQTLKIL